MYLFVKRLKVYYNCVFEVYIIIKNWLFLSLNIGNFIFFVLIFLIIMKVNFCLFFGKFYLIVL